VWPRVLISVLGFIFIFVGAVLLRVQVSRTVSSLRHASRDEQYSGLFADYDEPVLENSMVFWGVLWTAVALMAVNPVVMAVDAWAFPARMAGRIGSIGTDHAQTSYT
jgi:hypothetical protein